MSGIVSQVGHETVQDGTIVVGVIQRCTRVGRNVDEEYMDAWLYAGAYGAT